MSSVFSSVAISVIPTIMQAMIFLRKNRIFEMYEGNFQKKYKKYDAQASAKNAIVTAMSPI